MIRDLFLIAVGVGLCALVLPAWERAGTWRPRYRRFCTGCRIPHMSKTHLPRELSDVEIQRRAERITAAMRRSRITSETT